MPIADDVQLGPRVRIFHPELVNLYGCRIGADTKVGAFVDARWVVPDETKYYGVARAGLRFAF